jgi:prepilin-type N-terminal cleavage/methylation domain-containing protein
MTKRYGFTLVDLMVALVILTIVMTAVYSVFAFQGKATETASEGRDVTAQGVIIMDRLTRDLTGLWLPRAGARGRIVYRLRADQGRWDFPSTASLSPDQSVGREIVEVGYRLVPDTEAEYGDKYILIRRQDDTPDDNPEEGGGEIILSRDVISLDVVFLNNALSESTSWSASSLSDGIPSAVRLTLVLSTMPDQEETFVTQIFIPLAQPVVQPIEMNFQFGAPNS